MIVQCGLKGREEADKMVKASDGRNEVTVIALAGTNLVQEAVSRHGMSPTAAAALGRSLLGTTLLAAFREEGESVQVLFNGNGPLGNMLTIADSRGTVKGRVGNAVAHAPLREDGKLNVGGVVGQGTLQVSRVLPFSKEPYAGTVELFSGEVAEDFAYYLAQSEQINSAIGLGVLLGKEAVVEAAAGYLVTILPHCSEETLSTVEKNLLKLPNPTTLMKEGRSVEEIAESVLEGLAPKVIDELEPEYGPCNKQSLKGRMLRSVALLGREEVDSILEEQGKIELTCEFCCETFQFERGVIEPLLEY